jgi:hypothetical protein
MRSGLLLPQRVGCRRRTEDTDRIRIGNATRMRQVQAAALGKKPEVSRADAGPGLRMTERKASGLKA